MKHASGAWVRECPCEIAACDGRGVLLEMNLCAEDIFQADGGRRLLGSDISICHPEPARTKLAGMLDKPSVNAYFNTEKGEKRFFYQSPWYRDGRFSGYVEISFVVPEDIPHFVRE